MKLSCSILLIVLSINLPLAQATDYVITDYGASDGSGGSDDLSAIHAALAVCTSGDRVLIPVGVFQIGSAIIPKADVAIVGAGMDLSVLEYTGALAGPMVRIQQSGLDRVELTGLTLDGLGTSKATQGIEASGTSGHDIHHIRIRNLVDVSGFGPHGVYFSGSVTGSKITDNEFIDIGINSDWGAGIRLSHASSQTVVTGNIIRRVGRGGILLNNGSTDCIIRNNTVSQSGLTGPGLAVEVFGDSHRCIVEDNDLDHWLSIDSSDFVAVRRNTVISLDGSVEFLGLEMAGGSDNVFTGNTIGVGNTIGLSMSGPSEKSRSYLAGNSFSSSSNWGCQLQDDGGQLRQIYFFNNTFQQNGSVGFRFNAVSGGAGIRQIVFDGNQIVNNGTHGFGLYGHNNTQGIDELSFVNNTITGNGGDSIQNGYVNNREWTENTISDNQYNYNPGSAGYLANAKPTVQILGPILVGVGETLSLTPDYTDDGAPTPADVLWDFDDGLPVTSMAPTHVYQEVGTYTVALLAWDSQGRAAHSTVQVTVVPLIDADGDGLLDHHETLTYGTDPTNPDSDNDGYFDGAEVAFGTSPMNTSATPERKALISMLSESDAEVSYATKFGQTYQLETSADMSAGSWVVVESSISGTGLVIKRTYTMLPNDQRIFYRMKQM